MHGKPIIIHADNGYEFIDNGINEYCRLIKIKMSYSNPASPQQNGLIESWHKTLKTELKTKKMKNIDQDTIEVRKWIEFYNNLKRHSCLMYERNIEGVSQIGNKEYFPQTPAMARKISLSDKSKLGKMIKVIGEYNDLLKK